MFAVGRVDDHPRRGKIDRPIGEFAMILIGRQFDHQIGFGGHAGQAEPLRPTGQAEKIEAGIVWINCWLLRDLRTPFGGVKASGVGREGGWEALRFFTEAKNVCIKQ